MGARGTLAGLGAATATLLACATLPDLHYACDKSADACPAGWGCGLDKVCRAPLGRFAAAGSRLAIEGVIDDIGFADFDADGRGDLVVTSDRKTRLEIDFFDESLAVTTRDVRPLGGVVAALGPLTDEAHADLVVPRAGALTVAIGKADRTFGATAYPSIPIPVDDTRFAAVRVFSTPDKAGSDLLVLVHGQLPGVPGAGSVDAPRPSYLMKLTAADRSTDNTGPVPLFALPKPPGQLAGLPAVGRLDTTQGTLTGGQKYDLAPCEQIVIAYKGETSVHVYTPCRAEEVDQQAVTVANAAGGDLVGKAGQLKKYDEVPLAAGLAIVEGVHLADLDHDGNLDILVGVGGLTAVAFGSGDGHFTGATQPYGLPDGFPLALGDLNGDTIPDFIGGNGIFYSAPSPLPPLPPLPPRSFQYLNIPNADGEPDWTDAIILDANGNGFPDIAAVRGNELVFFNGSAKPLFFTPRTYPLGGAARAIASGDLDGDAVPDIAVTVDDDPKGAQGGNLVAVSWGRGMAFPDPPEGVGRFANVLQIGAAPIHDDTATYDLGIVSSVAAGAASQIRIAVLPGETSRVLTSPFGFPAGTTILRAALGPFTGTGHDDIAALASYVVPPLPGAGQSGPKRDLTPRFKLFVAPSTGDAQLDANALLITPGTTSPDSLGREDLAASLAGLDWANAELVAVDLDRAPPQGTQPRAEIVALVPPAGDGPGAILVSDVGTNGKLSAPRAGEIGGGAGRWKAILGDADGDGARDVAVLLRTAGAPQVVVLRNTGDHELDPAGAVAVTLPNGEIPLDVAFVTVRQDRRKDIAVLTATGVFLASLDGTRFSVERAVTTAGQQLPGGTAIAASDMDGDGVEDLAIAGGDAVTFYRGEVGRQ